MKTSTLPPEFIKRGLASGEKARRSGKYTSAASVIEGLRRRLSRARAAEARKSGKKRSRAR